MPKMIEKISKIIVISFFVTLIFLIVYGSITGREIDTKGRIIIGKFVSYKSYPKSSSSFFVYYINGVKFKESSGTAPAGFKSKIGKFYKIRYLDKYPGAIHPLYDQEVTDTAEILNSGFKMYDIKTKPRNANAYLFP